MPMDRNSRYQTEQKEQKMTTGKTSSWTDVMISNIFLLYSPLVINK